MIDIDKLTFAYGAQEPLFRNFSLRINHGEAWSVIGPSGCGKTTLLYLLAGLKYPLGGGIEIGGAEITRPRPRSGLVLQDHGLLPWSSVRENARLGLTLWEFYGPDGRHAPPGTKLERKTANMRVDYWLQKLGIADLHDQYPAQLSRGQRQKTAIARSLVMEPDLLLLDEPFSALDAPTREDLEKLIIHLHAESKLTYIVVTHDIEVAVSMGQKILALKKGCNSEPQIIVNACSDLSFDRKQMAFQKQCDDLRNLLGTLT
jgi:NitT/TauT family transport system ATP-binding protein